MTLELAQILVSLQVPHAHTLLARAHHGHVRTRHQHHTTHVPWPAHFAHTLTPTQVPHFGPRVERARRRHQMTIDARVMRHQRQTIDGMPVAFERAQAYAFDKVPYAYGAIGVGRARGYFA